MLTQSFECPNCRFRFIANHQMPENCQRLPAPPDDPTERGYSLQNDAFGDELRGHRGFSAESLRVYRIISNLAIIAAFEFNLSDVGRFGILFFFVLFCILVSC
jgi:hypothetical protein